MKTLYTTVLLSLFCLSTVFAQKQQIQVTNPVIKKDGNNLVLSFDMQPGKFPSNQSVTLTPIIYNGDGKWDTAPAVIMTGKHKNIQDRRAGIAAGDRRIIKKGRTEHYSSVVPYQDWMQYVSMAVEQVVEGCCSQFEHPIETVSEGQLLFYKVVPHYDIKPLQYELTELEKYDLDNPFLHPMEDYDKRYDILLKDRDKGTVAVIFKVASAVIDMNMSDNQKVLDAITKAFQLIEQDPNAILKHILVAGYASPEGSLALNTQLAKNRAEAVKTFLQSRMQNPAEHLFEVYNGREDWDGLRDLVEKSDMADKTQMLEIIDAYTMEQEVRKTRLKQLNGGASYRYMLENFYPILRTGGYVQVYYEIDRKATVATAVTDERGRTTWIDPDSPRNRSVTAINKALEYMVDNKFQLALDMMLEFKEDPRSWNSIGVCYMMLRNYIEADTYLTKALESGDPNAEKNLEQIAWARKVVQ